MDNPWVVVATTIVLIVLSAFFVAAEFALLAARRHRLEEKADRSRSARAAVRSFDELTVLLAGCQLGITACALALGAVGVWAGLVLGLVAATILLTWRVWVIHWSTPVAAVQAPTAIWADSTNASPISSEEPIGFTITAASRCPSGRSPSCSSSSRWKGWASPICWVR